MHVYMHFQILHLLNRAIMNSCISRHYIRKRETRTKTHSLNKLTTRQHNFLKELTERQHQQHGRERRSSIIKKNKSMNNNIMFILIDIIFIIIVLVIFIIIIIFMFFYIIVRSVPF